MQCFPSLSSAGEMIRVGCIIQLLVLAIALFPMRGCYEAEN